MKLSIVMPSHNVGPRINVNILNACAMGREDVEVIIRDNSGDAGKREFLSRIHEPHCRIISVDECGGSENAQKLLAEARGEFVFFICDDDYANSYAISTILQKIDEIAPDPSIIGVTGIFAFEEDESSQFVRFDMLDKEKALERFEGFVCVMPSIFQFSPIRRSVLLDIWSFSAAMPVYLSYHDWLMNCMVLAHGRMAYVPRYIYQYYNSNWNNPAQALKTDASYFRKAGIDTSGVRLQWLIAMMEGAQTFISKYQGVKLSADERQRLAMFWIGKWFPAFAHTSQTREAPDAKFDAQAQLIGQKWRTQKEFRINDLVSDIAGFYALTSPETAQRYYDFWK